jgi:DNA polymerase
MHHLSIDLETYSSVPIKDAGAQAYIRSNDFEILLFAYSYDNQPIEVVDLAQGEQLPEWMFGALFDNNIIKHAYNAPFEWACLSKYFEIMLPPSQWHCTMMHGLYAGYTAGLDATGKALGLPQDKQKLSTGKALIRYFCVPCKPTKSNGQRTRNYPRHDPDRWQLFKEYCRQDVVTEMEIENRLSAFPVPDFVQKQWETDLIINNRGVAVDMELVKGALELDGVMRDTLMDEAINLTGLYNPNSVKQLQSWLEEQTGVEVTDLRKGTVADMLHGDGNSDTVKRVLEIRQDLGKTSTKKYNAIESAVCADGRVRGLLQFYGANRTGRWAGRLVQVQNLPQTHTEPLELARELVKSRKLDALKLIYGSVNSTLSQLIRTAFVSAPNNVLIDADFSAIEARVIAWLAGEEWRLDVFRNGGDIYCASASEMFHCNVVKGGENGHLRARGKVAELALGYQGSVGAMRNMDSGHLLDDVPDNEMQEMVQKWRKASPKIAKLWDDFNDGAISVIKTGQPVQVSCCTLSLVYDYAQRRQVLSILLPSGRSLYYVEPSIGVNRWGGESILYMGVNDKKKWGQIETYGGKLTENCVQAIARDCLAGAIERLEAAGYPVVFHVHDEVVIDITPYADDKTMLNDVVQIMSEPIPWAQGLPLNADGWVGTFFTKD